MLGTIGFQRRGLAAAAPGLFIAIVLTLAPLCAIADSVNGQWLPMTHDINPPFNTAPARRSSSIIYDSVHDRLVMIGGDPGSTNDVWTLDLSQTSAWVQVSLSPSSGPGPRSGQMTIYDPVNDRIILFGGVGAAGFQNDVWQLKLADSGLEHVGRDAPFRLPDSSPPGAAPTWTQLFPSGAPPLARANAAVVYDPVGQRMIVSAGVSQCQPPCNYPVYPIDTWSLSLSGPLQWTRLSPSWPGYPYPPPSVGEFRAFAYDPDHNGMVIFGRTVYGYSDSDTWELSLADSGAWTQINASNPPPSRQYPAGGYDPVGKRFLIFGGYDQRYLSDVWALPLSDPNSLTWSQLSPTGAGPSGRELAASCFDPVRNRLAVFAGYNGSYLSDVHFLSLSGPPVWSYPFAIAPGPITPRRENTLVICPEMRQVFTFGGTGPASDVTDNNEVWSLDASSPNNPWIQFTQLGHAPSARHGHRAVWDPLRHRMLVLGGFDGSYESDLWEFATQPIPYWTQLGTLGTPLPGRAEFGLAYDPLRDQLIAVGGNSSLSSYSNDVWALPLSDPNSLTWSQWSPTGTPPDPRAIYDMQYDPAGDQMIFFGGETASGRVDDVWALELSGSPRWNRLLPSGAPPSARSGHAMAYDPRYGRMIVFGGYDGSYENDAWALQLGATPTWTPLVPTGTIPSARSLVSGVFDVVGNQMLFMGGWDGSHRLADTWALAWDLPATSVPVSLPDLRFALEGARPNPASGDRLNIAFSLPRAERARLDVLDLAGRKVASQDLSAAGAGRHVVAVTPQRALNPGVYVVRLTAGEGSRSMKVAVVR